MAPADLEIIFRYVMLYYRSPDGLRVLVPQKGHRAIMRDTATDTVFRLSEAFVRLEVNGQPAASAQTRIVPNGRLVAIETPLRVTQPMAPNPAFLETVPVSTRLSALIHLSGGTLTAVPSEAFPEMADTPAHITFGPMNQMDTLITDTTFYSGALPEGQRCELVIESPRRTVRVDVSEGARFELRNEDEKIGRPTDRARRASEEFQELMGLFDLDATIECDYFPCLCAWCGH